MDVGECWLPSAGRGDSIATLSLYAHFTLGPPPPAPCSLSIKQTPTAPLPCWQVALQHHPHLSTLTTQFTPTPPSRTALSLPKPPRPALPAISFNRPRRCHCQALGRQCHTLSACALNTQLARTPTPTCPLLKQTPMVPLPCWRATRRCGLSWRRHLLTSLRAPVSGD